MTFIRITIFLSIFTIPIIVSSSNLSLSNDLSTKALKETEKDLDNAILLIQQSLVLEPNNAKAWAIAGQIYLLNEDILSAERFYKKAKAIDPILEEVTALKSLIDDKKKENMIVPSYKDDDRVLMEGAMEGVTESVTDIQHYEEVQEVQAYDDLSGRSRFIRVRLRDRDR